MAMDVFSLTMCRVCERQSNLIDISSTDKQNYVEMFLACANVTFQVDDYLPKYLCRLCVNRLSNSFKFKQQCEETQQKLQDRLLPAPMNNSPKNYDTNDFAEQEHKPDDQFWENIELSCIKTEFFEAKDEKSDKKDEKQTKPLSNKAQPAANAKRVRFRCDTCKRASYKFKSRIEGHMRNKHGMAPNLYKCECCDEWLNHRELSIHEAKYKKPFQCQLCLRQFTVVANLQRHIRDCHEQTKNHHCLQCGNCFAQQNVLRRHIESIHSTERKYKCEHCSKSYKIKPLLQRHLFVHFPEMKKPVTNPRKKWNIDKDKVKRGHARKVVCQYCGIFVSVFNVKAHIETHNKHKPYKCEVCPKSFKTKLSISLHVKTHFRGRDFKCDICGFAFLTKGSLKLHQLVHTGEKPFKCEYCEKAFALKKNYDVHRRLHTGEKPFKCVHCTEGFIDLNGLKRHRKKVHSIEGNINAP